MNIKQILIRFAIRRLMRSADTDTKETEQLQAQIAEIKDRLETAEINWRELRELDIENAKRIATLQEQLKGEQELFAAGNQALAEQLREVQLKCISYKKQLKEREWIAVEDRLPKLSGLLQLSKTVEALCLNDDNEDDTEVRSSYYDYLQEKWKPYGSNVTHWRYIHLPDEKARQCKNQHHSKQ